MSSLVNQTVGLAPVTLVEPHAAGRIHRAHFEHQLRSRRVENPPRDLQVGGAAADRKDPYRPPLAGALHGLLELDREVSRLGLAELGKHLLRDRFALRGKARVEYPNTDVEELVFGNLGLGLDRLQ